MGSPATLTGGQGGVSLPRRREPLGCYLRDTWTGTSGSESPSLTLTLGATSDAPETADPTA